jgi:hypothetical protein
LKFQLLLWFFAFVLSPRVEAGTILISASANAGAAGSGSSVVNDSSAFAPTKYSDSKSFGTGVGTRYQTASYAFVAGFGEIGASATAYAVCRDNTCGVEGGGGSLDIRIFDALRVLNGPSSGFIGIDMLLEGTLSVAPTGLKPSQTADSASILSTLEYGAGYTAFSSATVCYSLGPCAASGTPIGVANRVYIPFSSGVAFITHRMYYQYFCYGSLQPCSIALDFLNTSKLGGAAVYDSNLQLLTQARLGSDSGYDYTRPLSTSAVPEPSSIILVGTASVLGAFLRRRGARPRGGIKTQEG